MGKGHLHVYDVIRRPVITEKSHQMVDASNQYVFEVERRANKIQIKEAVERIFDVSVVKVNTMMMPAKRGRRGRKVYVRAKPWKKAVVTLAPGQEITLFNV
ncbi:MAG: 50S ribosomal protein L23 [Chloroflexota bacterium]|jgi:large subunit ribosomal protein L23|nr:50S ribosomal protein L23 [Anaerolineae bacterium]HMM27506.1 50S ribosomal protein L23 [Aggregatilineaceae bacterium]